MALNRDKAFEVSDDGLVVGEFVHVVAGDASPAAALPGPSGSTLYLRTDGAVWTWTGATWQRLSSSSNFSFRKILSGTLLTIPDEQQMIVSQEIEIEDTGELEIISEVVIIA